LISRGNDPAIELSIYREITNIYIDLAAEQVIAATKGVE
jgi:hypothetical protein